MTRAMAEDARVARARRTVEVLRPYLSEARQARIRSVLDARTRSVTVLLEDVVSDHNGAAVLRTADAFGLMEVHVVPLPTGFRVSRRVALGSEKWMELRRHDDIGAAYDYLRARGFTIWASAVHGEAVPTDALPAAGPICLVFGNEHAGLSERASGLADGRFRIPMHGFVESLNISVATALALAQVVEPRRAAGRLTPLSAADRALVEARWYRQSVRAASLLLRRAGLPSRDEDEVAPAFELVDDLERAP